MSDAVALQCALLVAAFADPQEAQPAWAQWQAASGWEQHVDFASYLLLPRVYHNLGGRGVDDALYQRLKGVVRRSWAANAATRALLGRLAQLLQEDRVGATVLPPVALLLQDHSAVLAPDTPLALQIERRHATHAVDVLYRGGWRASVQGIPAWSFRGFIAASSCLKMTDDTGVPLELHWRDGEALPDSGSAATQSLLDVGLSAEDSIQFLFTAPGMGSELVRTSRALLLLSAAPDEGAWQCLLQHLQASSSPFLQTVNALSGLSIAQRALQPAAMLSPLSVSTETHAQSFTGRLAVRWSRYRSLLGDGVSFSESVRFLPGYLMGKWQLHHVQQLLPELWRNLRYHWRQRQGRGT